MLRNHYSPSENQEVFFAENQIDLKRAILLRPNALKRKVSLSRFYVTKSIPLTISFFQVLQWPVVERSISVRSN